MPLKEAAGATENAAKAALALLLSSGTHPQSLTAIARSFGLKEEFPEKITYKVERLAECAEFLGPAIHIQSDYGDEMGGRTPWELFDRDAARQALDLAEEAAGLARELVIGL